MQEFFCEVREAQFKHDSEGGQSQVVRKATASLVGLHERLGEQTDHFIVNLAASQGARNCANVGRMEEPATERRRGKGRADIAVKLVGHQSFKRR